MTFGDALVLLRGIAAMSRREVCSRSGLPYSTYSAIEAGQRNLRPTTCPLIAAALGVRSADLWAFWNALRSPGDEEERADEMRASLMEQARSSRLMREEFARVVEADVAQFVHAKYGWDGRTET